MNFYNYFQKLAVAILLCLSCVPGAAVADEVLPVAQGRFTATFVLDKSTPQPSIGCLGQIRWHNAQEHPRVAALGEGFVLGTRGDVVFVELSEEGAERLAHRRASQKIRIRKSRDPDPKMITARRQAAADDQPIQLGLHLRTVSVLVKVTKERVEAWERGIGLTFPDARELKRISYVDDRIHSTFYDIRTQFVSAVPAGGGRFEVTVIAQPTDAANLLKAEANGRLSVLAEGEPSVVASSDPRCYITHRAGNERYRIEIPCT